MGTCRDIFFGTLTLSILFSTCPDNVTDAIFQMAQVRFDMLYSDHNKFIAEGHSVAKGQIGSAHFYREGIPPLIVKTIQFKTYNESLRAAVACALGYRTQYASLGYNLTNYEKTVVFCDNLDSHVELEKKCDILINNGNCDLNNPYRTINGYCNNLKYPKWGAQLTPYGRLIAANFDDGEYTNSLVGLVGKLKINAKQILPQRTNNGTCDYDCYYSAEIRATPFYTLALQHSIFFRLHNQIADELRRLNPKWNDEKLYQEARRKIIAIYQRIVYDESIPTLFGADFAAKYKLNSFEAPFCGSYNENVDPSASNEFSHAAFRQFHANIPEKFNFYDAGEHTVKDNESTILEKEFNAVLRGLITDPNIAGPTSFSDTMRNKVFDNFNARKLGLDMPSIDILVGRDHGLSPYPMYLEKFFRVKVNTWDDLLVTISKQNINKLKKLYAGVQDLDLYVGLSLEYRDYVNYKYVGPVGKHILGEQFNRSKFGDRFFYCLRNNGNPFSLSQLIKINQWTLGRILCQTTDIESMLPEAFQTPIGQTNGPIVNCSNR